MCAQRNPWPKENADHVYNDVAQTNLAGKKENNAVFRANERFCLRQAAIIEW